MIVNNSSVSAHRGFTTIAPYTTSTHGVIGLTCGGANDCGGYGLRVVGVAPGGADTGMWHAAIEAQGRNPEAAQTPSFGHRTNTFDEIADVVMFPASDAAWSVNGTDLDVTMGMLAGPFAPPNRNA